MRTERKIPSNIIERTAELWMRWIANPRFDNGDRTGGSDFAMLMAITAAAPHSEETLKAFKSALIDHLTFMQEHDGQEIPEGERGVADRFGRIRGSYYFQTGLSCDYDPDEALVIAAHAAGITKTGKTVFPWKTDTYMRPDCIIVSAGYAAANVYHYPLSDGRWFVTDLNGGENMQTLLAQIDETAKHGGSFTIGKIEEPT